MPIVDPGKAKIRRSSLVDGEVIGAKIADEAIVNIHVGTTAAIASTKLANDAENQVLVATPTTISDSLSRIRYQLMKLIDGTSWLSVLTHPVSWLIGKFHDSTGHGHTASGEDAPQITTAGILNEAITSSKLKKVDITTGALQHLAPINLVANGKFESWSAGTGAIPDCFISGSPAPLYFRSASAVKWGPYSLRMDPNGLDMPVTYQRVAVKPSTVYVLSLWSKLVSTNIHVEVTGNVSGLIAPSIVVSQTSWTRVVKSFSTGASDSTVDIRFVFQGSPSPAGDYCYVEELQLTQGELLLEFMRNPSDIVRRLSGSAVFASVVGIAFTHDLGHSDYRVIITPTSDPGGTLGEVFVVKGSSGFVVYNSGINTTATFDYAVVVN